MVEEIKQGFIRGYADYIDCEMWVTIQPPIPQVPTERRGTPPCLVCTGYSKDKKPLWSVIDDTFEFKNVSVSYHDTGFLIEPVDKKLEIECTPECWFEIRSKKLKEVV